MYARHRLALFLLCAAFVADGLIIASIGPMLPELARRTGHTLAEMGTLFIAQFGGGLLAQILGGRASDRFGRRVVLLVAGITFSVAAVAMTLSTRLSVMLIWMTGLGLGFGGVGLAVNILASELTPHRRAATLNLVNLFYAFGAVAGPLLAGRMLVWTGSARPAMWIGAGLLLALMPIALRVSLPAMVPATSRDGASDDDAPGDGASGDGSSSDRPLRAAAWRAAGASRADDDDAVTNRSESPHIEVASAGTTVVGIDDGDGKGDRRGSGGGVGRDNGGENGGRDRAGTLNSGSTSDRRRAGAVVPGHFVWTSGLLLLLYVGAEAAVGGWTPAYLARSTGVDDVRAATLTSIFWISLCAGRGLGTFGGLHLTAGRLLSLTLGLAVVGSVTLTFAHGRIWPSVIALILLGLSYGPVYPTVVAIVTARFSHAAGSAMSRLGSMAQMGGMLLPALFGWLMTRAGTSASAWLLLGVAVAMAALWTAIGRRE